MRTRWLQWVQGGREAYRSLERRTAREATAQQRVLSEALARHAELIGSEEWKEKHCRLCPSCHNPCEKPVGCGTMVCGEGSVNSSRQGGCGHRFNWNDARPYKTRHGAAQKRRAAAATRQVAVSGRGVRHLYTECGLCGEPGKCIVGLRFRCIHCQNFSCCAKCEPRLQKEHDLSHVFEIMFEDDLDWKAINVTLPKGSRARIRRRFDPTDDVVTATRNRGSKRKPLQGAGLEGVIKGQKRGKYVLELPDGAGARHVAIEHLQPLLTQKQAEKLIEEARAAKGALKASGKNGAKAGAKAKASAAASSADPAPSGGGAAASSTDPAPEVAPRAKKQRTS